MKSDTEKTERIEIILEDLPPNATADEASGRDNKAGGNPEPVLPTARAGGEKASNHGGRRPWFIDIFEYPLSSSGILHIGGFCAALFIGCPFLFYTMGFGIEFIPLIYALPIGYLLFYFTECIRDSASGSRRASFETEGLDRWDCYSRLFLVVGCIAACFCPAAAYYAFTRQSDWTYRLLLGSGGFFFPMILLSAVLFDSLEALNPIFIVRSIARTFFPYCGMVLILFGGMMLFLKIGPGIISRQYVPIGTFIIRLVQFYMVFVGVALLGRFFRKYKSKLRWEVE
jgi:hypothetical protein